MKLYIIKKNGKKTVRKVFNTYEEARSYVRKLVRKNGVTYFDRNGIVNRNPTMKYYGYSIEQL